MQRASDMQVGGNHYKDMPVEPSYFSQVNRLGWCEANAVKYVCRHKAKNGRQDIEKAIHYLQLLLEWEYPATVQTDTDAAPADEVKRGCTACKDQGKCVGGLSTDSTGRCLYLREDRLG